jgi:hypothetical protein
MSISNSEQVVKAISEFAGAGYYSAKYPVSSSIEYNTEKYAPSSSRKETRNTRSDKKHFDRSKGHGGRRFSQPSGSGIWFQENKHP